MYQFGESEELLGEFLTSQRDHFVLATKFTQGDHAGAGLDATGNSRKVLVRSLEASLRRLRTDHVDLYWAHWPDGVTPVEEILTAFDDMVRAGKILHAGLSNFPAWRVARAATVGELRGTGTLIGAQFEYSLAERSAERELLPMADSLGLGAAVYSPLGGGLLTGKYRHSDEGRLTTLRSVIQREDSAQRTEVLDAVLRVAGAVGSTPARVAVAWVRERARRSGTAVIPIVGPRTETQWTDYLAALDLSLTDEQYRELETVSAPVPGVPHAGIAGVQDAVLGRRSADFDRVATVA
ncbi:oxidoreductase [Nakamurella endophytica]|uniref:Oxidoreductase n=1 Tax=Nakamurella endophytica TaxID=1748367 RepID=A0A917SLP1_9ACTN|nr:oxidoreductase [Nakamurella endophytica]